MTNPEQPTPSESDTPNPSGVGAVGQATAKTEYQLDEFDVDVVPGQRRGAHRAAPPAALAALPWVLVGVFVVACIVALMTFAGGVGSEPATTVTVTSTPTESATPTTVAPDVDRGVLLLVLNGTRSSSKLSDARKQLTDGGWIVDKTGNNEDRRMEQTLVVYKDESLQPTAQELVDFLGGGEIAEDPSLPEDMRVVIGANYDN
ncbi:MAG: LytR C-terminal domain-containing protein [Actinomycetales bacterium]